MKTKKQGPWFTTKAWETLTEEEKQTIKTAQPTEKTYCNKSIKVASTDKEPSPKKSTN